MEISQKNQDFGARLRASIESQGLKPVEFARKAGLKPNTLNNYLQGVSEPKYSVLLKIVQNLGVTTDYLLNPDHFQPKNVQDDVQGNVQLSTKDKINPTFSPVHEPTKQTYTTRTEFIVATQDTSGNPTYSVINHKAAANYLSGYQSQEYFESLGVVTLPRVLVGSPKQGVFFQIEGDSMTPKFQHGDWVACTLLDRSEWHSVRDLDCYVVVSATYGIQFKRIKNTLEKYGFLRCKSDNRRHRAYNIEEENLLQLFRFVLHISPDASNPEDALYQKVDYLEDTTTDLREMLEQLQHQMLTLPITKTSRIPPKNTH